MPASFSSLQWHPQGLTASLFSAFNTAAGLARAEASRRNPAPDHIGIRLSRRGPNVWLLAGKGPLAHLFEGGVGEHTIAPLYAAANALQTGGMSVGARGLRSLSRRTRRYDVGKGGAGYALKFEDGGFVRGIVRHPGMKARPYIRPAGLMFPVLYRQAARMAMARMAIGR